MKPVQIKVALVIGASLAILTTPALSQTDTLRAGGADDGDKLCSSYGLQKGTEAYANCMLRVREQNIQIEKEKRREELLQEYREAQEREKEEEAEKAAKERERMLRACRSAMDSMPSRDPYGRDKFALILRCDADPEAHLKYQPPQPPQLPPRVPSVTCQPWGSGVRCEPD